MIFQIFSCFLFFLFVLSWLFLFVGLFNASGVFIDWDMAIGVEKVAIVPRSSCLNLEKLVVVDLPEILEMALGFGETAQSL